MNDTIYIFFAVLGAVVFTATAGFAILGWLERRYAVDRCWATFELLIMVLAMLLGFLTGKLGWL